MIDMRFENKHIRYTLLFFVLSYSSFAYAAPTRTFSHSANVTLTVFEDGRVTGPDVLPVTVTQTDTRTVCVKAEKLYVNAVYPETQNTRARLVSKNVTVRDTRGLCTFTRTVNIKLEDLIWNAVRADHDQPENLAWEHHKKLPELASQCATARSNNSSVAHTFNISVKSHNTGLGAPPSSTFFPSTSTFTIRYNCFPKVAQVPISELQIERINQRSGKPYYLGGYDLDSGTKFWADIQTAPFSVDVIAYKEVSYLYSVNGAKIALVLTRQACGPATEWAEMTGGFHRVNYYDITSDKYLCVKTGQGVIRVFKINRPHGNSPSATLIISDAQAVTAPAANHNTTAVSRINLMAGATGKMFHIRHKALDKARSVFIVDSKGQTVAYTKAILRKNTRAGRYVTLQASSRARKGKGYRLMFRDSKGSHIIPAKVISISIGDRKRY